MDRRSFLTSAAVLAATPALTRDSRPAPSPSPAAPRRGRFKLKYAPHIGMFRQHAGGGAVDQLRFMADEGFVAMEDNGMARRPVAEQERIAAAMQELSLEMGVFVAHAEFQRPSFATDDPDAIERIRADMRSSVEVAKRVRAKWCTVVPGSYRKDLEWDYQTALVVDNLRRACEILEPAGLTMVLEPLNAWTNHPGCFLTKVPQAYMLCRAVDSPSCKVLDDLYHQQISEGNLIPNIDLAWDEIGYFQVGDNPGRNEPGTGEINYRNVFRHIHQRGFDGILGMEHGNSQPGKQGERAVIDAYAAVDDF